MCIFFYVFASQQSMVNGKGQTSVAGETLFNLHLYWSTATCTSTRDSFVPPLVKKSTYLQMVYIHNIENTSTNVIFEGLVQIYCNYIGKTNIVKIILH